MSRTLVLIASLVCFIAGREAHADPIHAIADGAYWHHDSGWVFPEKIAEFARLGFPQEISGSVNAAAYYERVIDGSRVVASVSVFQTGSAGVADTLANLEGKPVSESPFAVGTAASVSGTRKIFGTDDVKNSYAAFYYFAVGEWLVRIHIEGASAYMLPMLDSFALGQRWDSLSVPTPR